MTPEQEAEKYADSLFGFSNENHHLWEDCQRHFISGIESKYVESEKLKCKIETIKMVLNIYNLHDEDYSDLKLNLDRLEQQLKQLQK